MFFCSHGNYHEMMPTAPPVPRRNGKQSVEMLGLFGQTEGDGRGQTRRNKGVSKRD